MPAAAHPPIAFAEIDAVAAIAYAGGGCSQSDPPDCAGSETRPHVGGGLAFGGRPSADHERVGIVVRARLELQATTEHVDENRGGYFLLAAGPYVSVGDAGRFEATAGLGLSSPGGGVLSGLGLGVRYTHHVAPFFGVAAQTSSIVSVSDVGIAGLEASLAVVLQLEDHLTPGK